MKKNLLLWVLLMMFSASAVACTPGGESPNSSNVVSTSNDSSIVESSSSDSSSSSSVESSSSDSSSSSSVVPETYEFVKVISSTNVVRVELEEGAALDLTAPATIEGKEFKGWFYEDGSLVAADAKMGTESVTIYAKWEIKTYTVTVKQADETDVVYTFGVEACAATENSPEIYDIQSLSSVIKNAYVNTEKVEYTITGMPETWELKNYELTVTKTNYYNVTVDGKANRVQEGATYVLETLEREGYEFLGWKDAEGNDVVESSIVVTEDLTFVSCWKKLPVQVVLGENAVDITETCNKEGEGAFEIVGFTGKAGTYEIKAASVRVFKLVDGAMSNETITRFVVTSEGETVYFAVTYGEDLETTGTITIECIYNPGINEKAVKVADSALGSTHSTNPLTKYEGTDDTMVAPTGFNSVTRFDTENAKAMWVAGYNIEDLSIYNEVWFAIKIVNGVLETKGKALTTNSWIYFHLTQTDNFVWTIEITVNGEVYQTQTNQSGTEYQNTSVQKANSLATILYGNSYQSEDGEYVILNNNSGATMTLYATEIMGYTIPYEPEISKEALKVADSALGSTHSSNPLTKYEGTDDTMVTPTGFNSVTRFDTEKPKAMWMAGYNTQSLSIYNEVWFAIKVVNGILETKGKALTTNSWIYFHLTQTDNFVWTIEITINGKVYQTQTNQSGTEYQNTSVQKANSLATILYGNSYQSEDGEYVILNNNSGATMTLYATEIMGCEIPWEERAYTVTVKQTDEADVVYAFWVEACAATENSPEIYDIQSLSSVIKNAYVNTEKVEYTITGMPETWELKNYELTVTKTNYYNVTVDGKANRVQEGATYVLETLEREGYEFLGWKDAEGNDVVESSIVVTEELTFVSCWKKLPVQAVLGENAIDITETYDNKGEFEIVGFTGKAGTYEVKATSVRVFKLVDGAMSNETITQLVLTEGETVYFAVTYGEKLETTGTITIYPAHDPEISKAAGKVLDSAVGSNTHANNPLTKYEGVDDTAVPAGFTKVTRYDSKDTWTSSVMHPCGYDNTSIAKYDEVWFALKSNGSWNITNNKDSENSFGAFFSDSWIYFHLTKTSDSVWDIEITKDGKVITLKGQSGIERGYGSDAMELANALSTILYGKGAVNNNTDGASVILYRGDATKTFTIYSTEVMGKLAGMPADNAKTVTDENGDTVWMLRDGASDDSTHEYQGEYTMAVPTGFTQVKRFDSNTEAGEDGNAWTTARAWATSYDDTDLSAYSEVWFAVYMSSGYINDKKDTLASAGNWVYFHLTQTAESLWTIEVVVNGAVKATYADHNAKSGSAALPKDSIAKIIYNTGSESQGIYLWVQNGACSIYSTELVGILKTAEVDPENV